MLPNDSEAVVAFLVSSTCTFTYAIASLRSAGSTCVATFIGGAICLTQSKHVGRPSLFIDYWKVICSGSVVSDFACTLVHSIVQ